MFKKIINWWRWEGKNYHRNFIKGIKNLFKWFPIVWKDRDWDDHFIFEIIHYQQFFAKYQIQQF